MMGRASVVPRRKAVSDQKTVAVGSLALRASWHASTFMIKTRARQKILAPNGVRADSRCWPVRVRGSLLFYNARCKHSISESRRV
jgi:hypothetical protein